MPTLAEKLFASSEFGLPIDLTHAGSTLENPYVYDSSARELKAMAERGLVSIVDERRAAGEDGLIEHLRFMRLR